MTNCYQIEPSQTSPLLDLLPSGAFVFDRDLIIVDWNQTLASWTGITKDEALGKTLAELFPEFNQRRYTDRLNQVIESGFPVTYSASLHRHFLPIPARHGLAREWMIQQTEIRCLDHDSSLALATIQDVTLQYMQIERLKIERQELLQSQQELADANQALLERNRELDDFTRIASHDLKEPLRKFSTFAKLLTQNLGGRMDEDSNRLLGEMNRSVETMRTMVKDLMAISRVSLCELKKQTHSLGAIVHEAMDAIDFCNTRKQPQLVIPSLPEIQGDRRLLTQLFQNLIGNSLKFSPGESPCIEITAETDPNGHWILGVRDQGIGVHKGQLEKIFEPFVRLHSRDQFEGSGFGLAICKKVVAKHGGRIWAEANESAGLHVRFTLS